MDNRLENNWRLSTIFDKLWMKNIEWIRPNLTQFICRCLYKCFSLPSLNMPALCRCKWEIYPFHSEIIMYSTILFYVLCYIPKMLRWICPLVNIKSTRQFGFGLRLESYVHMVQRRSIYAGTMILLHYNDRYNGKCIRSFSNWN